jgi:hypothetical protein
VSRVSRCSVWLASWSGGLVNGTLVYFHDEQMPFISLALRLAGATAVVTAAALMAMSGVFKPLRYYGRNSIVIDLAFFLPMVLTHTAIIKTGLIADAGTIAALTTIVDVVGSLVLFRVARGTWANFLFDRPEASHLAPPKRVALQPAE